MQLGLHIAVLPHINDGLNNGAWRNAQRINPLERCAAVLHPCLHCAQRHAHLVLFYFGGAGEGGCDAF